MESQNLALVELLDGISDRKIRRKTQKLIGFGEEAVRSLGELDIALRGAGGEELQVICDAVLSHVRRLLEYLGSIATTPEGSVDQDFDFSAGEFLNTAGLHDPQQGGDSRLREVLEELERGETRTDEEKWRAITDEMDSLQYGLSTELGEFDRRFAEAMRQNRQGQALRDLNDATRSLMDGVFAMITTVYEQYLGYVDRDRMIPGYRDTLGKALAVRRCIAVLRQEVQELNRSIQDSTSDPVVLDMSFKLVVDSLNQFMENDAFAYLRSGDRDEFAVFRERLHGGDAVRNRLDCEGLDKYLDSLAVVSQRDVLIKHDADLREKISHDLEVAIAFADLQPASVPEMIHHAFVKAGRLFGLNERLDTHVFKWSKLDDSDRNDLQRAVDMGRILKELVQPPEVTLRPDDPDFF